jgi:glycosyltransferase involved in cell wall biosynthesis
MSYADSPIISIIIPVYNREKLVVETLESVLRQTYSNWECIVVDDGSTDNTWEVLLTYAKKDERIKVFQRNREPKGAPKCRNIGMEQAKGDYLIFLDSDDLLAPWCLAERNRLLQTYPNLDVLLSKHLVFNKSFEYFSCYFGEKYVLDSLLQFEVTFQTTAPTWRTSFIKKHRIKWSTNFNCWQDVDFAIAAFSQQINYQWGEPLPDYFLRKQNDPNSITSISKIVEKVASNFKTYEHWLNNEQNRPMLEKNFPDYMLRKFEFLFPSKELNEFIYSHPDLILKHLGKGSLRYIRLYNKTRNVPLLKGIVYRLRPCITGIKRRPKRIRSTIITAEMIA